MRINFFWLIHIYTGLGIPIAALTLYNCIKGEIKTAFLFMFIAIFIDATDGFLARRFNISKILIKFDGRKLDDLVDFLNYVLVPIAMAYFLKILPGSNLAFGLIPVIASAYGFSQVSSKTEDSFFLGFPSYWNLVVFYLYFLKLSALFNSIIFIVLSAAVFVPIKYIIPFKTKPFAKVTNIFCVLWSINLASIVGFLPNPPLWLVILSIIFPAYYISLSIYLHFSKTNGNGNVCFERGDGR